VDEKGIRHIVVSRRTGLLGPVTGHSGPLRRALAGAIAIATLGLSLLTLWGAQGPHDPNAVAPTFIDQSCGDGQAAITTVTAKGFDPLTASASELEANNYPPRPARSDPQDYATWKKLVLSPSATVSTCAETSERTAGRPVMTAATTWAPAWSGYQTADGGFSDVEAEWHLPAVHGSGSKNSYSSTWVGLGDGYPGDQLIQAGTESDWVQGGPLYSLWWEIYPGDGNAQVVTNASRWHALSSELLVNYSMWNCAHTQRMAYVSAISGASFHASFQNAGDNHSCAQTNPGAG